MAAVDRQFIRVLDGACAVNAVQYAGPWPPPERLVGVKNEVGILLMDPENANQLGILQVLVAAGDKAEALQRGDFSKIPDGEAERMSHVARGAEYSVVGEWGA